MRTPPGNPASVDMALAKQLGLRVPLAYAKARDWMLEHGWRVDATSIPTVSDYPAHPEIACGRGYDAICSATFTKGTREIQLIVDQSKPGLPVVHLVET